ncbi:MAG: hypothetical protein GY772_19475 [bacterium]|nr:hypothetical protein [bacterium]
MLTANIGPTVNYHAAVSVKRSLVISRQFARRHGALVAILRACAGSPVSQWRVVVGDCDEARAPRRYLVTEREKQDGRLDSVGAGWWVHDVVLRGGRGHTWALRRPGKPSGGALGPPTPAAARKDRPGNRFLTLDGFVKYVARIDTMYSTTMSL